MRDLAAQQHVALFVDVTGFRESGLADDLLEAGAVELAIGAEEVLVGDDALRDVFVGQSETQFARLFVERGFGDQLADQLAVEADGAGLVRRNRPAGLAAETLQLV